MADKRYMFGMADITIGKGEDAFKFDGKDFLQVEGGNVSITPMFADIQFADFGEVVVQKRVSGYEGSVTLTVGQEDERILDLAIGALTKITDVGDGTGGVTDAKIGTVLKGHEVRIHPRDLPESTKDEDWVLYNCASTEGFERDYNAEQGSVSITLTMMPREGFDASSDGNFFYRGGTDPNAE